MQLVLSANSAVLRHIKPNTSAVLALPIYLIGVVDDLYCRHPPQCTYFIHSILCPGRLGFTPPRIRRFAAPRTDESHSGGQLASPRAHLILTLVEKLFLRHRHSTQQPALWTRSAPIRIQSSHSALKRKERREGSVQSTPQGTAYCLLHSMTPPKTYNPHEGQRLIILRHNARSSRRTLLLTAGS